MKVFDFVYIIYVHNKVLFPFFEVIIRIITSKEFYYNPKAVAVGLRVIIKNSFDVIILIITSKKGNNNILSKFGGFDRKFLAL